MKQCFPTFVVSLVVDHLINHTTSTTVYFSTATTCTTATVLCVLLSFPDVMVGFTSSEYTASESDGFVSVTVMRIGASAIPISVSLTTTDGDAVG